MVCKAKIVSYAFCTFCLLVSPSLWALQSDAELRATISDFLTEQTKTLAGEMSFEIGNIDRRSQLADCADLQAFLPAGRRLWGSTTLGLRCQAPKKWSIYVPVSIQIVGDYVVTANGLLPGQVITDADVRIEHGDLTKLRNAPLTSTDEAIGLPLKRSLAANQPLFRELLDVPPLVQQGQQVRVVSHSAGFTVSNQGTALNRASIGQLVRVRLGNGKTIAGLANKEGDVEVAP